MMTAHHLQSIHCSIFKSNKHSSTTTITDVIFDFIGHSAPSLLFTLLVGRHKQILFYLGPPKLINEDRMFGIAAPCGNSICIPELPVIITAHRVF